MSGAEERKEVRNRLAAVICFFSPAAATSPSLFLSLQKKVDF